MTRFPSRSLPRIAKPGPVLLLAVALLFVPGRAPKAWAAPLLTLTPVATGLFRPIGLAPHGDGLIASVGYPDGAAGNFVAIDSSGQLSLFSNLSGLSDEVSIAQHSEGAPYLFNNFSPPGRPAKIGIVKADGTGAHPNHRTLGGEFDPASGVAYDTTGLWGGGLFVVTEHGHLWAQRPAGNFKHFLDTGVRAESIDFIPSGTLYGPLSGALVVPARVHGSDLVAAVTHENGGFALSYFRLGIPDEVEHIVVVPPDRNLYVADYRGGQVLGIAAADLASAGLVGELLAVGEDSGSLYRVVWTGTAFESTRVAAKPGSVLEDLCFTAAGVGAVPAAR